MNIGIIMAGFGGQGVMSMGQVVCYAGLDEGKEVSWLPSYGPEMRGGTANCTVVVSDQPVGSPIVSRPDAIIIMNLPSLDRFEPLLKPGGIMIINTSLCDQEPSRKDVRVIRIPATDMANELGNIRVANMVALGAFLAVAPVVKVDSIVQALQEHLPEHQKKHVPLNKKALEAGVARAREQIIQPAVSSGTSG
jgi:2-oxoglutarate ferredoxin oxidoreductase subunit gamma